jgi:ribosomal protein S18 acetylase RimI-like enzyme
VSSFQSNYSPLVRSEWGSIAVLQWDRVIFGFAVGNYIIGDLHSVATNVADVRDALSMWAIDHNAELIACSIPADNIAWIGLIPEIGFCFVDYSLTVSLPRLQKVSLPAARLNLRSVVLDDLAVLEQIGARAFRTGRYHADVRFPQELADQRYKMWINNAFQASQTDQNTRLYVVGPSGTPNGFIQVVVQNRTADLRLAAVDPELQGGLLGYNLYAAVLMVLKEAGISQVTAKIPASNVNVMNLYASLGFRLSMPTAVFHYHTGNASHLLSLTNATSRYIERESTHGS